MFTEIQSGKSSNLLENQFIISVLKELDELNTNCYLNRTVYPKYDHATILNRVSKRHYLREVIQTTTSITFVFDGIREIVIPTENCAISFGNYLSLSGKDLLFIVDEELKRLVVKPNKHSDKAIIFKCGE